MRKTLLATALFAVCALNTWALDGLVWPTPNTAYLQGKTPDTYLQDTGSGDASTGLYGCVRTGGFQFHEGVDLKALKRDRSGEATDAIFAVRPGVVAYTSNKPGYSNYGRYVVIEHTEEGLTYYTLYAHLSEIEAGIAAGTPVTMGQRIATMGHSAGNGLPIERAHLHLEFNMRFTDNFQPWYTLQKFGAKNRHGNFNGFNFIGWDALNFYGAYRSGTMTTVAAYLRAQPTAITAIVKTTRIPNFIQKNPALLTAAIPAEGVQGWQIEFSPAGLPKLWTPLTVAPKYRLTLLDGNAGEIPCRRLKASAHKAGRDLRSALELMFGGRF